MKTRKSRSLCPESAYSRELDRFLNAGFPFEKLDNQRVMITGATGLIGSCLVDLLMNANRRAGGAITILAVGRDTERLQRRFAEYADDGRLRLVEQDIATPLRFDFPLDYLIHGASNADPATLAKAPVDTMRANIQGTDSLLSYGRTHGLKRFLFISSGEVYGQPANQGSAFTEDYSGYLNYSSPRSCYPSGKRAAEVLCQSYISQYSLDAVIVRPCHVYGPTFTASDSRALAQFLGAAAAGRDITLKSLGLAERSHCYVFDAALAILHVLLLGKTGEVYNIADRHSTASIREFAEKAAHAAGRKVIFDIPEQSDTTMFSKVNRAVLDASKIEATGWQPLTALEEGIAETIAILKASENE